MHKRKTYNEKLLLVLIVLGSFLSLTVCPFETTQQTEVFIVVLPGLLFTIYLSSFISENNNLRKSFQLLALLSSYCFFLHISFISCGLAVPLCGALGAALVFYFVKGTFRSPLFKIFILKGFFSSFKGLLLGSLLFFVGKETGIAFIIVLWQTSIGLALIRYLSNSSPNLPYSIDLPIHK